MTKAASIFLRADISSRDVERLIRWMENPAITRYLNEDPAVVRSLRQLLASAPAPMLTYHFNRRGRFFLVCRPRDGAIGFVKLRELPERGSWEIVYVIGEESLWGNGYGESAIRAALSMAFLEWRARWVIARIYPGNQRSIRSVRSCGFRPEGGDQHLLQYSITMGDYLARQLG